MVRVCHRTKVVRGLLGAETNANYRKALLNIQGITGDDDMNWENLDDDDLPENRWYKYQEEDPLKSLSPEGVIPIIQVSDKELAEWCDEWQQSVVVSMLGKKSTFASWRTRSNVTRQEKEQSQSQISPEATT